MFERRAIVPRRGSCWSVIVLALSGSLTILAAKPAIEHGTQRRFTVADDIELVQFAAPVTFSPDHRYFVVVSERGRLDLNRPESSLRVYLTQDIKLFLSRPSVDDQPSPLWSISMSTCKNGPIISDVRWLADSSGVAFLAKTITGNDRLFLGDIRTKTVESLTPEDQHVTAFDVHSSSQFVYAVLSSAIREKAVADSQASEIAGTGRSLDSLIFPESSADPNVWVHDLSDLWAVSKGRRFRVVDAASGHPIPIHLEGQRALALSPDGTTVVTALSVENVPAEWESLYPPFIPSFPFRVRAGRQNPEAFNGQRDISEYVLIDLGGSKVERLTHAPLGNTAGWVGISHADWSSDGQSVALTDTFLGPGLHGTIEGPNIPCVALVDLATARWTCLEDLKQSEDEGRRVYDAHFVSGNKNVVTVRYLGRGSVTYVCSDNGSWVVGVPADALSGTVPPFDVSVKQSLNGPPVLVAMEKTNEKYGVVWDPNPQLQHIQMGEVSVFKWKDKTGRDWSGGLYKPPDYVKGKRYPLVIQTHGFNDQKFHPSGPYPTGFAAQELAAAGFLVLQVEDCPLRSNPQEGPCQVAGYEAAVERLSTDELVDSNRLGIIGFSRSCYYVLEALTTSTLRFKAASITDGIDEGYLQYTVDVDRDSTNAVARDAEGTIGAPPFGTGLQQWLKRSPEFNIDKVDTPLQVVALGHASLLFMWEPYASLRYLKKPVDLMVLDSTEHVLTNPKARLISQGGTVDWFRFWLQGYEDPDPTKSDQYRRWNELRKQRDGAIERGSAVTVGAN